MKEGGGGSYSCVAHVANSWTNVFGTNFDSYCLLQNSPNLKTTNDVMINYMQLGAGSHSRPRST